jgi:hypothetical protein
MKYLKLNNKYYEIKGTKKYRGKVKHYIFIDGKLKEIIDNGNLTIREIKGE